MRRLNVTAVPLMFAALARRTLIVDLNAVARICLPALAFGRPTRKGCPRAIVSAARSHLFALSGSRSVRGFFVNVVRLLVYHILFGLSIDF
ncbi:MAG: hypothetical protein J5885_05690 [Clostridia bacterium]|nr:hypothetical protein [Clostridia bacterium]